MASHQCKFIVRILQKVVVVVWIHIAMVQRHLSLQSRHEDLQEVDLHWDG
jgi:hypothetical protein